jgi:peptide/nickel transport system permease protein
VTAYIVRRLAWILVLLVLVSLVAFVVFYLFPSTDPAVLRAGRSPSPDLIESIRHNLGLDKSKPEQFWQYMKGVVLHFDFGHSYQSNEEVRTLIFDRLPATIYLTVGGVILWLAVAIPVGLLSSIKRRSIFDRVAMSGALIGISAPVYWLGLVMLYLFSKDIGKFHLFLGQGSYQPPSEGLGHFIGSMILPWIVLATAFAAFYARLLRSNMLEVMSEDYIRTARAKGLRERRVILRHGMRSAITPVVTVLGLDIGVLLGGAILTETVFNIPGIGRLSYSAIVTSDLTVIQGTVLLGAFFIVFLNLAVDILYAFLDPRIRYS